MCACVSGLCKNASTWVLKNPITTLPKIYFSVYIGVRDRSRPFCDWAIVHVLKSFFLFVWHSTCSQTWRSLRVLLSLWVQYITSYLALEQGFHSLRASDDSPMMSSAFSWFWLMSAFRPTWVLFKKPKNPLLFIGMDLAALSLQCFCFWSLNALIPNYISSITIHCATGMLNIMPPPSQSPALFSFCAALRLSPCL